MSVSNLMGKFDTGKDVASVFEPLESKHGSDSLLDSAVILFNKIIQVTAGPKQ